MAANDHHTNQGPQLTLKDTGPRLVKVGDITPRACTINYSTQQLTTVLWHNQVVSSMLYTFKVAVALILIKTTAGQKWWPGIGARDRSWLQFTQLIAYIHAH